MYMVAPVRGIPALTMGDDVCAVISASLNTLVWPDGGLSVWGDDVIVIAGKIIAKAQGRYTHRDELMVERFEEFDSRNLLMFRNVPRRMALFRPENPDEEAATIRRGFAARFGGRPGVIISGSEKERSRGRGRRDVALGSAGLDTCWVNFDGRENESGVEPKYTIGSYEALYHIVMEPEELENLGARNRCHRND